MRNVDFSTRDGRQSFYNSREWQNVRGYILSRNPLCASCKARGVLTVASVVDHIIDLQINSHLALEPSNLSPMCKTCHDKKTNESMHPNFTTYNKKWDATSLLVPNATFHKR